MRTSLFLFLFLSVVAFGQGTVIFNADFQLGIPVNFTMLNLDQNAPNAQVTEFNATWIPTIDP